MNDVRRRELKAVSYDLSNVISKLGPIVDDEQEYFDNIPENLQYSCRYDTAEEILEKLYDVFEEIEDLISDIDEIIEMR